MQSLSDSRGLIPHIVDICFCDKFDRNGPKFCLNVLCILRPHFETEQSHAYEDPRIGHEAPHIFGKYFVCIFCNLLSQPMGVHVDDHKQVPNNQPGDTQLKYHLPENSLEVNLFHYNLKRSFVCKRDKDIRWFRLADFDIDLRYMDHSRYVSMVISWLLLTNPCILDISYIFPPHQNLLT